MAKTKYKFTSFAAPTPEDIAAFDALAPEERRTVIEAELAKGFSGTSQPLNRERLDQIKARVLARHAKRHARSEN